MAGTSSDCLNMFNFISVCYCSMPSTIDVGPHVKMCKEHREGGDALRRSMPLSVLRRWGLYT